MRGPWKVTAAAVGASTLIAACSSPTSTVGVAYDQFRFTCCANSTVLLQPWHRGQLITVQWTAETTGMTADDTHHPITLTALLTGPYTSVAALKAGGLHSETLQAAPLRVTDRTPGNPASTIALPIDLAAGWYNLATTASSAGGSGGGATVIQLMPLNSKPKI